MQTAGAAETATADARHAVQLPTGRLWHIVHLPIAIRYTCGQVDIARCVAEKYTTPPSAIILTVVCDSGNFWYSYY